MRDVKKDIADAKKRIKFTNLLAVQLEVVEWDMPLNSTNVDRVAYDVDDGFLYIQFKNGVSYRYNTSLEDLYNVGFGDAATRTAGEWGPIGKSPSVGAAVWQYLRDNNVPYNRVAWFPKQWAISDISPTLDPSAVRNLI